MTIPLKRHHLPTRITATADRADPALPVMKGGELATARRTVLFGGRGTRRCPHLEKPPDASGIRIMPTAQRSAPLRSVSPVDPLYLS